MNSCTPKLSSSCLIAVDTDGCAIYSLRDASATLPHSAVVTKYLSWRRLSAAIEPSANVGLRPKTQAGNIPERMATRDTFFKVYSNKLTNLPPHAHCR